MTTYVSTNVGVEPLLGDAVAVENDSVAVLDRERFVVSGRDRTGEKGETDQKMSRFHDVPCSWFLVKTQARISFTTRPETSVRPIISAAVAIGQLLVIEAHQVQNRRVKIVNVDLVLNRVPAELRRWLREPCRP